MLCDTHGTHKAELQDNKLSVAPWDPLEETYRRRLSIPRDLLSIKRVTLFLLRVLACSITNPPILGGMRKTKKIILCHGICIFDVPITYLFKEFLRIRTLIV